MKNKQGGKDSQQIIIAPTRFFISQDLIRSNKLHLIIHIGSYQPILRGKNPQLEKHSLHAYRQNNNKDTKLILHSFHNRMFIQKVKPPTTKRTQSFLQSTGLKIESIQSHTKIIRFYLTEDKGPNKIKNYNQLLIFSVE